MTDVEQAQNPRKLFQRIALSAFLAGVIITLTGNALIESERGRNEPSGMALRMAGLAIMLGTLTAFLLGQAAARSAPRPVRTFWRANYLEGTLVLADPAIDDNAVAQAVRLYPMLTILSLEGAGISDDALQHLASLRRLEHLNLRGTRITDVGLEDLESLTRLQRLVLADTGVTDRGVKLLQTMLPNCELVV